MPITTCPDAQAAVGQVWEIPPLVSCSPCSCAPGPPCSLPTLNYFSSTNNCSGIPANIAGQFADGNCHSIGNGSLWMQTASMLTGTCTAMGGQLQSTGWQTAHALCSPAATQSNTCSPGQSCFSLPGSMGARLCISTSGNAACPPGWDDKTVGFQGTGQDTRSCVQCSCGSMQGVTCSG